MEINVISSLEEMKESGFCLIKDNWNDWWEYDVAYSLYQIDGNKQNYIGNLKIGRQGFEENHLNKENVIQMGKYSELPPNHFSVGVNLEYYSELRKLGDIQRESLLKLLKDISFNPLLYRENKDERVMNIALLRSLKVSDILGTFNRVALGHSEPTPHHFIYNLGEKETKELDFETNPKSLLPSNIHAIIGRNGVGKTHLLKDLLHALLSNDDKKLFKNHTLPSMFSDDENTLFNGAIYVSFSAFDDIILTETENDNTNYSYDYIGLKKKSGGQTINKSTGELVSEFIETVAKIKKTNLKMVRWEAALKTLETETLFGNAGVLEKVIAEKLDYNDLTEVFKKMSSGHKIVLLTITKLIELATEKILILMDEPETHLHPPLLSAFIRALSDFLQSCNGVTIVATHSPVILQEVPKRCVWILQRINNLVDVYRPEIQTFGENIGILTREVFGLEVVNTGFHTIIENLVSKNYTYDEVIDKTGYLGKEADYLLRYLIKNSGQQGLRNEKD